MRLEDFDLLGPWAWVVLGILFCVAEIAAPGAFLIWLGLAAIAVGLVNLALPLWTGWSLLLFSLFAVVFALVGRRYYGAERGLAGVGLNRRADALVGRTFIVEEAIVNGEGRIRVADGGWRVVGPDLPRGAMVRVAAVADDGVTLRVEAA